MAEEWEPGWQHDALGIAPLWHEGYTGSSVKVAVLDTGMAAPTGIDDPSFEYLDADGRSIGLGDPNGHTDETEHEKDDRRMNARPCRFRLHSRAARKPESARTRSQGALFLRSFTVAR